MHNVTIHTWTAVFLRHLANTSFMASLQAQTEPYSGLTHEHASCCHAQLVSCCLLQRFKFHTQHFLLSGWLLTNVQVNIITTLHDTRHTCIYIRLALPFISSFYTSSIFLGRLAALHSLRPLHLYINISNYIQWRKRKINTIKYLWLVWHRWDRVQYDKVGGYLWLRWRCFEQNGEYCFCDYVLDRGMIKSGMCGWSGDMKD
jgi:hypothetical protein